ncbi:MAG: alpha/beta hydrolase [Sandaracinaceae bacterium]|nr:alpha/beta hydrolase [Sandaracinaceae bacterium]
MEYEHQGFATGVDGTRLFWGVSGKGPSMVLNDGIGCDGWAWNYLHAHFAETHRVLHWHYRGHGRSGSPRDPRRIDVPALAADMACVMDAVNMADAILVGHSMGTQVCLESLRADANRARALILISGSYGRVTRTFHGGDALEAWLPAVIETVKRFKGLARAIWGRLPPRMAYRIAKLRGEIDALALSEADFVAYMEHLASMDPDLFLAMLERAGEHTAEDLLESVQVPTLIIAGEHDSFTPQSLSDFMAEKIPNADYLVIKGATHAAPIEQPVIVAARIDKFLRERMEENL